MIAMGLDWHVMKVLQDNRGRIEMCTIVNFKDWIWM